MLLLTTGPTAAWRHSGIGASRTNIMAHPSFNEIMDWMNKQRRHTIWEEDGIESSVALNKGYGLSFLLNGKNDGNAKADIPTQIMAPLVSAILHPDPQKSLVVGLGTGSSAGWLADIPSMRQVDVVELEPIVVKVAELSGPVNRNALQNDKINLIFGDAREHLITTREKYDLIFSEPSNPYRAGIASLYTREFYESIIKRLKPGGHFSQWMQTYEVDGRTIRTIYNTLSRVFPYVETWETLKNDLLFVCSLKPPEYRAEQLRRRINREPFKQALAVAWGVTDLEGFLARYVANNRFAEKIIEIGANSELINTDDRTLIEFAFARNFGKEQIFSPDIIRNEARQIKADRPPLATSSVDWHSVAENAMLINPFVQVPIPITQGMHGDRQQRALAFNQFINGNLIGAYDAWREQEKAPAYPLEYMLVGESAAESGNIQALSVAEKLRATFPTTAEAILARFYWRRGDTNQAVARLSDFFIKLRTTPWPPLVMVDHALDLAKEMAWENPYIAEQFHRDLAEPFSVYIMDQKRMDTRLEISSWLKPEYTVAALHEFEPYPYWNHDFLYYRYQYYKDLNDPLTETARHGYNIFLTHAEEPFSIRQSPELNYSRR
jgi:spermidine synthase